MGGIGDVCVVGGGLFCVGVVLFGFDLYGDG